MPGKRVISFDILPLKRVCYLLCLLLLCSMLLFCMFYLASSRERLIAWFFSLDDCFYRRGEWATVFFTPATKANGNYLAAAGITLCIGSIAYLLAAGRRIRYWQTSRRLSIAYSASPWYGIVMMAAVISAYFSWHSAAPAYDEIFSAVNCAELHPVQTLSYYMLPNNHIYFNLVNNIFFSWLHKPVGTGRFLSVIAYIGTLCVVFYWLRQQTGNWLPAMAALMPAALQFIVWGMAAQARGYELQLLCGWLSFITLLTWRQRRDTALLKVNTLCNVIGFAMVSSYLYYFLAQAFFVLAIMFSDRKSASVLARYMLVTICMVFLLYLPALCFSGIPAFTANRYVTPAYNSMSLFLPDFLNTMRSYINYCFSMLFGEDRAPNFILFALPVALLFFKSKEKKQIGVFYLLIWVAFAVLTMRMRRVPFHRNLIVQLSLTMGIVVYTYYSLVTLATSLIRQAGVQRLAFGLLFIVPVCCYALFLAQSDKRDIGYCLYYNDANAIYNGHVNEVQWIPSSASIGFSEECFYAYYLFRKDHPNAHRCLSGTEEYYVKRKDDLMPPDWYARYEKWKDGSEDYEYYKKR